MFRVSLGSGVSVASQADDIAEAFLRRVLMRSEVVEREGAGERRHLLADHLLLLGEREVHARILS